MIKLNNVLLIDDDEVTNYINTKILKVVSPETKVTVATNGLEGLKCIDMRIDSKEPEFDAIIIDISMPEMDGWQFIEALSADRYRMYLNANIVMLTSSVFEDDIIRAGKYPLVKTFLSKPLDIPKLNKILNYGRVEHQRLSN
jgi:CheY-like chemotaxis protein